MESFIKDSTIVDVQILCYENDASITMKVE